MTDLQLQQVRDPEGSVYPHHEQQQIAKSFLPAEQVFDLSDLFPITDGFDIIHKNPVNISLTWLDYVH
jgi:hypothetical protein